MQVRRRRESCPGPRHRSVCLSAPWPPSSPPLPTTNPVRAQANSCRRCWQAVCRQRHSSSHRTQALASSRVLLESHVVIMPSSLDAASKRAVMPPVISCHCRRPALQTSEACLSRTARRPYRPDPAAQKKPVISLSPGRHGQALHKAGSRRHGLGVSLKQLAQKRRASQRLSVPVAIGPSEAPSAATSGHPICFCPATCGRQRPHLTPRPADIHC